MGKPKTRLKPGETEYTGTMGASTTGIPESRPESALSASDQARLARISDLNDPHRKFNSRIWHGETPQRTPEQVEGDKRS
jgi:hypothetical protein